MVYKTPTFGHVRKDLRDIEKGIQTSKREPLDQEPYQVGLSSIDAITDAINNYSKNAVLEVRPIHYSGWCSRLSSYRPQIDEDVWNVYPVCDTGSHKHQK